MKSRFLSHLSHEFRTPLNGIIGLTRLLLNDQAQGEESVRQIKYIQRAAEDLTELVDDLLDLAKAEAGKLTLHLNSFDVSNVFSALRGVFSRAFGERCCVAGVRRARLRAFTAHR